ncbi:MAG: hypothetical protein AAF532_11925 [Planctomycetota bacterium]
MRWLVEKSVAALCVVAVAGCGGAGGPEFVPVSGRLTIDGEPVARVTVEFRPIPGDQTGVNTGGSSRGYTDADGRFTLTSAIAGRGEGVAVGRHRVRLRGRESIDSEGLEEMPEDERPPVITDAMVQDVIIEVPPGGTDAADISITTS